MNNNQSQLDYEAILPWTIILIMYIIPLYITFGICFKAHTEQYETFIINTSIILITIRTLMLIIGVSLSMLFKAQINGYRECINPFKFYTCIMLLPFFDIIISCFYFAASKFFYDKPDPIVVMLSLPLIILVIVFGFTFIGMVIFGLYCGLSRLCKNCSECCGYLIATPQAAPQINVVPTNQVSIHIQPPRLVNPIRSLDPPPIILAQSTSYEVLNKINIRPIADTCSVCREKLEKPDIIVILKCSHYFHEKCIKTWFRTKSNKSCPLCRDTNN